MKLVKRITLSILLLSFVLLTVLSPSYAQTNNPTLVFGQQYTDSISDAGSVVYNYYSETTDTYALHISTTGRMFCTIETRLNENMILQEFQAIVEANTTNTFEIELKAGRLYEIELSSWTRDDIQVSHALTYCDEDVWSCPKKSTVILKGTTKNFGVLHPEVVSSSTWKIADPNIATVDEIGNVYGMNVGETTMDVSITTIYGRVITGTVKFCVTDPYLLNGDKYGLNIRGVRKYDAYRGYDGNQIDLIVAGVSSVSKVEILDINKKNKMEMFRDYYDKDDGTYHIVMRAFGQGNFKIRMAVDGKTMPLITIEARKLSFKNDKYLCMHESWGYSDMGVIVQGSSRTLKVKGMKKGDKITFRSEDSSIVSVNKNGKIKGKKIGTTSIIATVNHVEVVYPITVTNKYVAKALMYAKKNIKNKYSQEKRMEEGYSDCSSFAWRAYASGNYYLGNKNWAPTAADIAKWCDDNNYTIYHGIISVDKLLPGDLIFWDSSKNGRYHNIWHVEFYLGNNTSFFPGRIEYYFKDGGDSDEEGPADVVGGYVARPTGTKVSDLKVKQSKKNLDVSWDEAHGAVKYQIYRSESLKGTYKKIATVKGKTSYTDTKVKKGKTYYYKVRAVWKSKKTYYGEYSEAVKKKVK